MSMCEMPEYEGVSAKVIKRVALFNRLKASSVEAGTTRRPFEFLFHEPLDPAANALEAAE